jgi:hypothetical protein
MNFDIDRFERVHLWGDNATRSPAPHWTRAAALLVLAGMISWRPRALPGAPIALLSSALNYRFQVKQ